MRILVLGSLETLKKNEAYFEEYADLARTAMPEGAEAVVDIAYFDDLYIALGGGTFTIRCLSSGCDLREYDLLMIRGLYFRLYIDVLKTVGEYAEIHKIAVINNQRHFRSGSKLDQAVRFHTEGIPSPFTVFVTKAVLQASAEDIGITFPCIMKATLGAHGADNYVVKSMGEARAIQASSPELRFILQQFVPNDGDFRLLMVGGGMLAIKRQAKEGSHLNNTSQGGTATLVPLEQLPIDFIEHAKQLAKQLDLTIAGMDVLQDSSTGEFYFLEVNSQPQMVSGAFLEAKRELFRQYLIDLQA